MKKWRRKIKGRKDGGRSVDEKVKKKRMNAKLKWKEMKKEIKKERKERLVKESGGKMKYG